MKKKITLFIVFFIAYCSYYATAEGMGKNGRAVDDEVLNFLGKTRLAVIYNSENVETYQIDWGGKADGNTMNIQGYPVVRQSEALNDEQKKTVKDMIGSTASYEFQWSKRTKIRPSYALRFVYGREFVDVVIDLDSRQWAFYHKGQYVEEDISKKSAAPVLSNIIKMLFKK